jgi:hypothetical protein
MKFSREVIPLKMTSTPYFKIIFNHSKIADLQASEMDTEFEPLNVRL